jgi:hypothetical protein
VAWIDECRDGLKELVSQSTEEMAASVGEHPVI